MLSHRPRFFPEARQAGMDLTLSGHTHGGQVGVAFGGIEINPVSLFHHYAKGLYVEAGKQLYVNVGVGTVGVPVRSTRQIWQEDWCMPASQRQWDNTPCATVSTMACPSQKISA